MRTHTCLDAINQGRPTVLVAGLALRAYYVSWPKQAIK